MLSYDLSTKCIKPSGEMYLDPSKKYIGQILSYDLCTKCIKPSWEMYLDPSKKYIGNPGVS